MQFLVHLQKISKGGFLPLNYQYELSSAIYRILGEADANYSYFLHQEGYTWESKRYKPFTFSFLDFDKFKVHPNLQRIEHLGDSAQLDIRFVVDRAAENFIKGLFINQKLSIGDRLSQVDYEISQIHAAPPIHFEEKMAYHCLSPIFLSANRTDGGTDFLSPNDDRYNEIFKANLLHRLVSFHPETNNLNEIESDFPEIHLEPGNKIRKKGITIKSMGKNPIKVIGYQFDFELTAPPIIQELGYYGGFGSKNALGFGCVMKKDSGKPKSYDS